MKYIIDDHEFSSIRAAQEHIRKLLHEIGFCTSVIAKTNTTNRYYERLLALAQRHLEADVKLKQISDFIIRPNSMNHNAYEMCISNKDGSIATDISWRHCIDRHPTSHHTNLLEACRVAVDDQIREFRSKQSTVLHCYEPKCQKLIVNNKYDVDHIIHFTKLVDDFVITCNITSPMLFNNNSVDHTNRTTFLPIDQPFERAFADYHRIHARLRVLCGHCNKTRSKYRQQKKGAMISV